MSTQVKQPTKKPAKPQGYMSEDVLLNEYDRNTYIPKKVREGLVKLGPEGAMKEVEFARWCGVSCIDLGGVRDEHFADFYVEARGKKRIWFGSKEFAARMKVKIS